MTSDNSEYQRFVADTIKADMERLRVDTDQYNRPTDELLSKTPYGVSESTVISAAGRKRKRNKKTGQREGAGVPAVKSHKVKSTLDVYGQYIPQTDQDALMRFLEDSESATTVNLSANYDGVFVPSDGKSRPGGVPDRLRLAHNRIAFIKSELDPRSLTLLKELLLASRWSEDRPMTVVEVAQSHAAHLRNRQSLISFGMGLMAATAWTVRDLYDKWEKKTAPERQRQRRQQTTRIEQGRRERQARIR